jgi:tetratricopeptide (TPR) repeat protein
LTEDPNHFEANLYLAQVLIARKKWSEADPVVHRALQMRPDSLDAKLVLADLYRGEGRLPDARSSLEAAEKSWPESLTVHRRLSEIYDAQHLRTEAARERVLVARLQPKGSSNPGPATGDAAPEFRVTKMGSGEPVTLRQLRHSGPVLLVFGSFTCPNFRAAADTLNRLYAAYKGPVPFYLIYIREAHSTMDWASTRNQREGIVLKPAATMDERQEHATMCVRRLHIAFPALLDSMQGGAEKAYLAWPSKAYLVNQRGRILFSSGLSEQDFKPDQLESALREVTASPKTSPLQRTAQ